MFQEQIEKNRVNAFTHFVEVIKKQNKDTISINGDIFSYSTRSGVIKKYKAFKSFDAYRKSDMYENRMERVNGFIFVELLNR